MLFPYCCSTKVLKLLCCASACERKGLWLNAGRQPKGATSADGSAALAHVADFRRHLWVQPSSLAPQRLAKGACRQPHLALPRSGVPQRCLCDYTPCFRDEGPSVRQSRRQRALKPALAVPGRALGPWEPQPSSEACNAVQPGRCSAPAGSQAGQRRRRRRPAAAAAVRRRPSARRLCKGDHPRQLARQRPAGGAPAATAGRCGCAGGGGAIPDGQALEQQQCSGRRENRRRGLGR